MGCCSSVEKNIQRPSAEVIKVPELKPTQPSPVLETPEPLKHTEPNDAQSIGSQTEVCSNPSVSLDVKEPFVPEPTPELQRINTLRPASFLEGYKLGRTLRSGEYGEIRHATSLASNQSWVVKVFRKILLVSSSTHEQLKQEISIHRSLNHQNIIKVHDYFEDDSRMYIVMEYCEGDKLLKEIMKKRRFQEHQAAKIIKQLLLAVEYLHDHGIIHRDIKAENILMKEKGEVTDIKLLDFWTAVRLESGQRVRDENSAESSLDTMSFSFDLRSCGLVAFSLLNNVYPSTVGTNKDASKTVRRGSFDMASIQGVTLPEDAQDLINLLLAAASNKITAKEALNHIWLTNQLMKEALGHNLLSNTILRRD